MWSGRNMSFLILLVKGSVFSSILLFIFLCFNDKLFCIKKERDIIYKNSVDNSVHETAGHESYYAGEKQLLKKKKKSFK